MISENIFSKELYVPLGYAPQLVGWIGKAVISGSEYDRKA
jgi:hypothetical protein